MIPLAAFIASRPSAATSIYGFAAGIYAVGQFVCHQLPARSFHLWGAQLPVCARCTGVYLGAAATAVSLAVSRWRHLAEVPGTKADAKTVLLLAMIPTALTLAFEWTTGVTPA